jgi:hypothetical protein
MVSSTPDFTLDGNYGNGIQPKPRLVLSRVYQLNIVWSAADVDIIHW